MKRITTWEVAREIGWMWLLIPTPSVVGAVAAEVYPGAGFVAGALGTILTIHLLAISLAGAYTEILRRHPDRRAPMADERTLDRIGLLEAKERDHEERLRILEEGERVTADGAGEDGNPTPEREGLFGWMTAASAERGRRWSADTRVRDLAIRMHRDKVNDTDVPVYFGRAPDSEVER